MAKLTVGVGVVLILTGLAAYIGTGMASWTALIPSFLGILFVALGVLGRRPGFWKPAMIGVVVLAVLGLLGTIGGFGDLYAVLAGEEVDRPVAAVAQSFTALLCLLLLAAGGRVFAERARS